MNRIFRATLGLSICAVAGLFIPAQDASAQNPPLASLTLAQPTLFWGQSTTGTATLSAPAPAGGTNVNFLPLDPGVTVSPSPVRVAAGETTATFQVRTTAGSNFALRTIEAIVLDTPVYQRVNLTLEPPMFSITLPARAVGGSTVTGTLSMGHNQAGNRLAPANFFSTGRNMT